MQDAAPSDPAARPPAGPPTSDARPGPPPVGNGRKGGPAILLGAILVGGLALRLWYLVRPLDWLVSFFPADDFFYYLEIARHLARGDGSTFDGLTRTNGYQPLLTWLLAAGFRLGLGRTAMVYVGLAIPSAAGLAAAWLAARVTVLLGGGRWLALAPAAVLALGLYWLKLGLTGFETMLAVFLLLATLEGLLRDRPAWWTGLMLGLAGLARVDSALLAPALALFWASRGQWRKLLVAAAVAGAVCLPWVVWSLARFGTAVPQSGSVKMIFADPGLLPDGLWWFGVFLVPLFAGWGWVDLLPQVILYTLGVLVVVEAARGWRRHGWLLLYPLSLALAYALLTDPRDSAQYVRYTAAGILVAGLLFLVRRRRLAALWPCILLGAMLVADLGFHRWAARTGPLPSYAGVCQREVPGILAEIVGPGDLVGCFDAGSAGYFSPVPVVNLDGLVNTEIVAMLRDDDPAAGTWADRYRRYFRQRGITILIGGTGFSWVGLFPDLDDWQVLHPPLPADGGGEIVFLRVPEGP